MIGDMVAIPMNASADPQMEDDAAADGDLTYAYKPNLVGAPWVFSLKREGIAWEYGRRSGLVRYDQVRRVRLSYRPATLQMHRFLAEVWSPQNPKLQISSTSFRGLMEQARQDGEYTAFVTELHRRLAAAGTAARFESGMNALLYWTGAAVMAVISATLVVFLFRVLANGDLTGAAVVVGLMVLFVWQVGTIFYRNRPQIYRPDAPPAAALPRA